MHHLKQFFYFIILGLVACNVSVNKDIIIEDGKVHQGNLTTVNGNILIGENCKVDGICRTVNGLIEVGQHSTVDELQTVNGSIRLNSNVIIEKNVQTVNGSVNCDSGVVIRHDIKTINGSIKLKDAEVENSIRTTNGDIFLNHSLVKGDIIIKRKREEMEGSKIKIYVGNGSTVEGNILADENAGVEVIISKDSEVKGKIHNAITLTE
ncbi:MAG: hypothetical protein D6813_00730 [Calditrichaeota bacterium]|nr:MAG: hypothetical protein D6813_00730 [Calditrichota bacterium]